MVGQVGAIFHPAHVPVLPVGAGSRDAVGQQPAILADFVIHQRHRAIFRKCIGIEQHVRRATQLLHPVQHSLVLQAIITGKEISLAALHRHAKLLEVPQGGQPFADLLASRDALQVGSRQGVLRLDPLARLLAVDILQPAVGIGDGHAVQFFAEVAAPGDRVLDWSLHKD